MITSTANAQIRTLTQLKKKAKERRQQQLYVAEGVRMFREAPAEEIECIYVSASFLGDPENAALLEGRRYEVLSDAVFGHVSDTQTPQGILCLMRMRRYRLSDVLGAPGGVWLILENIQDPGNLGTMLRVGEGAGIAGVIMDRFTADIYNPKTIRSTMGSIYRVPFYITEDLPETIREIKSRDIRVYAAYLKGSRCYDEEDYTGSTAFLIGNEGNGLTEETAALADRRIRIPMHGKVESLNAAMAAGILMYEADRQRRAGY